MDSFSQPILVDLPEQPARQESAAPLGKVKLRTVDRQQTTLATIYVDELIPADNALWKSTDVFI
jgi:hypothetical protein